jgi:3-deoxy-D-manno-octulosonate 8-phosphate phosphatase (KDO 8-P phosphatase)
MTWSHVKTLSDLTPGVQQKLTRVKLLLMDVDGVLTDGVIRLDDNGIEAKNFSTRDGLALFWVKQYGLATGVISGRRSAATEFRCQDLHVDEIHLDSMHKLPVLEEILKRRGLSPEHIAYIGDDVIDLVIMKRIGVSAAPNDAHPEVLQQVDIVLDYPGGRGAVRHFIDLWLMATGRWESAIGDILNGNF